MVDVDLSTNIEEDKDIIEQEREKNKNLLEIGKKYNEIDEAYQNVISNISAMIETEKKNPLNVKIDEPKKEDEGEQNEETGGEQKKEANPFELTNDELKRIDQVVFERKEREELDKFKLTEEEEIMIKLAKLTDEEKKNIKKNELSVLDKIVTRMDNLDMFTEEEKQVMEEIENFPLTEEQIDNAQSSKLSGDEEKIATQRLSTDDTEITEEKKKEKIKKFKILKLQYELYKEMEKKDNTKYKILKMKKNKVDMIKDYELLLKKVEKKFDTLYLVHSKQEFLNDMKMKQIEAQNELARSQQRKNTRRGTKRKTNRLANILFPGVRLPKFF